MSDRLLALLESTYPYRVLAGALFFLLLGLLDWGRNPGDPRRAKEYLFLLGTMVAAVVYGVVHDQVTATISPEYFLKGKELEADPRPFRWAVTVLAAHAAYGPGLLAGAALLIANNPGVLRPLPYRELARVAALVVACAAAGAILGGVGGRLDLLQRREDAALLAGDAAATRFLVTWGVHAGSYLGGAIGTVVACVLVRRRRRQA